MVRLQTQDNRLLWASFAFVLLLASAIALRILLPFFAVLLLSLATGCLIYHPYRRLVALLRGHRRTSAIIVCLLLCLAILVPVLIIIQSVTQEAQSFYELTTGQLDQAKILEVLEERREEINRLNIFLSPLGIELTPQDIYRTFASTGVELGRFFYRQGVDLAKGLFRLIFGFCFWVLILYYLMVDAEQLKRWFLDTLPLDPQQQQLVLKRFTDMAASLLVGNGLAGLIQGFAGGVVFYLTGLPGPALWGVVMAILAFIPVIGISLVFVPTSLVLLIAGEPARAALVFFPLLAVATVVEYWLKPNLVGRRAQMHTLVVFLSLLGGLDTFGAVGLVVGPLIMTAFLALISIYRDLVKTTQVHAVLQEPDEESPPP